MEVGVIGFPSELKTDRKLKQADMAWIGAVNGMNLWSCIVAIHKTTNHMCQNQLWEKKQKSDANYHNSLQAPTAKQLTTVK